jgi:uncharacterized protein YecT (DUF1311 family)
MENVGSAPQSVVQDKQPIDATTHNTAIQIPDYAGQSVNHDTPIAEVPSIDCLKPEKPTVDVLICADSQLLSLDAQLNSVYQQLQRFQPYDSDGLRSEQQIWLRDRSHYCDWTQFDDITEEDSTHLIECLRGLYSLRLTELQMRLHNT